MGVSTRPTQLRRQVEVTLLSGLMALFLVGAAPKDQPDTVQPAPSDFSSTLPAATTFALVQDGDEAIELSARFTQNSKNYSDAVDWTIKSSSGEKLFQGSASVISMKLHPGAYEVIGHYGNIDIDEAVTLPPQTKLAVNFVLNAGGLRVLPRLPENFNSMTSSITKVYALGGAKAGRLVSSDAKPGEILKLSAGSYRIETRYDDSNVSAVTDIDVKPGLLRSLDIDHHAGLAKLSLNQPQDAQWLVMENGGPALALPSGTEVTAVLKPGNYVAEARTGGKVLQQAFIVTEGGVSEVVLTAP